MQALVDTVRNEMRGAWRFRRYALFVAWGFCLLGWLIVYCLPDSYEARARVNVDTRTALRPLLQGIAVDQDVESQLNLVRQSLLGRNNLDKVATQVGLDVAANTPQERDALITDIGKRIVLTLEPPTVRDPRIPNTLYSITYKDESRTTALKVVDVLLNSFVEGTMGSERSGTATAEKFLRQQLAEYDQRLVQAESRVAAFKKQNMGLVPGDQGDYFQRLNFENQEVKRVESLLNIAGRRRTELQRQLNGEAPFIASTEPAAGGRSGGGNRPQDTASRIQETQARLDDLLLRFTDKHPDVLAARETLQQLKDRQAEEIAALKRGDPGAASVAGATSNPVYQTAQLQLNQLDVEIAALRGQLADHQRNYSELRRLVDTVPEVEAEYARLNRDYDVTKAQYNALRERLERAKVSGDAEDTGVVKFNIVDPPSASFSPVFPNRPLFLIIVLILGLGAGAGVAYLMHMLKPVFSGRRTLAEMTGLAVIGEVTRTWVDRHQAEMRRGLLRYAAAAGLLLVVFVVVFAMQGKGSHFMRQFLA